MKLQSFNYTGKVLLTPFERDVRFALWDPKKRAPNSVRLVSEPIARNRLSLRLPSTIEKPLVDSKGFGSSL